MPDRPLPDEVDDGTSDWLYTPRRSYLEQLVVYREQNIAALRPDDDEDE